MEQTFTAEKTDRLDVLLGISAAITRSRAGTRIKEGQVKVNGVVREKAGYTVKAGDTIAYTIPEVKEATAEAEDLPLDILYEDDDIAVVIKPAGMVVHPAAGNEDGTLVNALLFHLKDLSGIGGEMRPGIVHRLDKDTSGLLMVAKNDKAHLALSQMLKERSMEKHYLAVVEGNMKEDAGLIDAPIGRSHQDRKKMAVTDDGRPSRTQWQVVERLHGATLLNVHLITGRTHQIRVHMASIHHPVAGDPIYGVKNGVRVPRLMLHAHTLDFCHPITGQPLHFEAPLPPEFAKALEKLRQE